MRIPVGPEPVPLETVADVIARMEQLSAAMPLSDGVRAFNEMYLVTTQRVDAAIAGGARRDASRPRARHPGSPLLRLPPPGRRRGQLSVR